MYKLFCIIFLQFVLNFNWACDVSVPIQSSEKDSDYNLAANIIYLAQIDFYYQCAERHYQEGDFFEAEINFKKAQTPLETFLCDDNKLATIKAKLEISAFLRLIGFSRPGDKECFLQNLEELLSLTYDYYEDQNYVATCANLHAIIISLVIFYGLKVKNIRK